MKNSNPLVRDEHFPTDDEDEDGTYPALRSADDRKKDIKAAKKLLMQKAHKQFRKESR